MRRNVVIGTRSRGAEAADQRQGGLLRPWSHVEFEVVAVQIQMRLWRRLARAAGAPASPVVALRALPCRRYAAASRIEQRAFTVAGDRRTRRSAVTIFPRSAQSRRRVPGCDPRLWSSTSTSVRRTESDTFAARCSTSLRTEISSFTRACLSTTASSSLASTSIVRSLTRPSDALTGRSTGRRSTLTCSSRRSTCSSQRCSSEAEPCRG
jgi:hypothetical protein